MLSAHWGSFAIISPVSVLVANVHRILISSLTFGWLEQNKIYFHYGVSIN